jgi:HAD superfamily hydrolase (TIGR01509 family)
MSAKIKNIFFDVGNTLLFPNRERIHAPFTTRGTHLDPEHLRDLERRTKNQFDAQMNRDGSTDHGFWWMFYSQLLSELHIEDSALRDLLVERIRQSANWDRMLSGTREQLLHLGTRYRIAVISNADGKIVEVLQRCGIADCFLTITDSGLVGYEKPHPEIFRQALLSLHAQPEESLYVGDVYSVDYAGAVNAGMQAILMDVSGAYRVTNLPRIESLNELEASLADR